MLQPRKNKKSKNSLPAYTAGGVISGAASGASTGAFAGPWGMAAGAVVGGILGGITSGKQKKEELAKKRLADTNNFNSALEEQSIYATQFKEDNINDLPVYANGGEMNTNNTSTTGKYDTVGGDLLPISDNAEIVAGNTHKENNIDNSYGVTLSENGNPVANVENKEVVVDNELVFSDKLKKGNRTFASIALDINTKIGELQVKSKESIKPAEKFSNERTIQGLEAMNKRLFQEQELVKANTIGTKEETIDVVNGGVPVGRNGLDIKNANVSTDIALRENTYGQDMLPLVADNIANLVLTNNAPDVIKPITKRAPILDTRININPQLANVVNTITSSNEAIRANTNNSAVARANITATNLKGLEASNNIYATKQAQERQLKNQQLLAVNAVNNENADANMDYQNEVRDSLLQKNASYSKNITNLVEDFSAVKENDLQKNADDLSIELALLDDPTGEKAKTFLRMNKGLGAKSRANVIQELERMKQFNINKKN